MFAFIKSLGINITRFTAIVSFKKSAARIQRYLIIIYSLEISGLRKLFRWVIIVRIQWSNNELFIQLVEKIV